MECKGDWVAYLEKQKEQKPKFYPGDVVKCTSTGSLWVRCKDGDNIRSDGHTACIGGGYELASKEEVVQFFKELTENGYQWDCIKGMPMKKEQKPTEWSVEDKFNLQSCIAKIELDMQHWGNHGKTMVDGDIKLIEWLKSLPERFELQPKQEWSEEEYGRLFDIEQYLRGTLQLSPDRKIVCIDFLKSLRPQLHWKPSETQMGSLRLAIDSANKAQMNATADILNELYEQLKKL